MNQKGEVMKKFSDISIREILLEEGLYNSLEINYIDFNHNIEHVYDRNLNVETPEEVFEYSNDFSRLTKFLYDENTFNDYCPKCNSKVTFKSMITYPHKSGFSNQEIARYSKIDLDNLLDEDGMPPEFYEMKKKIEFLLGYERVLWIEKKVLCVHCKHEFRFYFLLEDRENDKSIIITKIGQSSSINDFLSYELDKYKSVLANYCYEYKRAVGLFSHGVGIGAFVYLRRIIEHLVHEKFKVHEDDIEVLEEDFMRLRFVDKIGIVKDHIPKTLVENKYIYAILSKGVHQLSEEECKSYFPVIRVGIELILDEEIAAKERSRKVKEFSEELNRINSKESHLI